jgi:RHS repeat-associated protein
VVAVDRLGSVRWRRNLDTGATAQFDYWPYGQEKPSATGQEREKFGTYYRDATGLDYADQRYYASTSGRFLTADRFVTSTALGNPTRGWNRYAYVEGDPINFYDPKGLWLDVAGLEHPGETGGGWTPSLNFLPHFFDVFGVGGGLWIPASVEVGASPQDLARDALQKVRPALRRAASTQNVFTASQLDCISGIETGRTWDPNLVAKNGRVGLFQFNEANWQASGTSIPWEGGQSAKDPETAATVALALLYRKLGYSGVSSPTEAAITRAIDNFGESDDRYGQAVMDCAKELDAGNFERAYQILADYASWVAKGRP